MEKKQVFQQALKQLNNLLELKFGSAADGSLFTAASSVLNDDGQVQISSSRFDQVYTVLLQPWAPQKEINALILQIKTLPAPAILFADFVNPVMAEKFRRRSISFVDTVGNVSLKSAQFDLYVKGKKSSQLRSKRVRGRAFNAAGLKLIFAIFNQPQFLQASYRDISNKVNIALGSVGPVMDDLYTSSMMVSGG